MKLMMGTVELVGQEDVQNDLLEIICCSTWCQSPGNEYYLICPVRTLVDDIGVAMVGTSD